MKFVRIVTEHPELAFELQSLFESRSFSVEVNAVEDHPFSAIPDIEIDLTHQPREEASRMARALTQTEFDVFEASGIPASAEPSPIETRNQINPEGSFPDSFVMPIQPGVLSRDNGCTKPDFVDDGVQRHQWHTAAVSLMRTSKQLGEDTAVLWARSVTDHLLRLRCVFERKRQLSLRKRAGLEARINESRVYLSDLRRGRPSSRNAWLASAIVGAVLIAILLSVVEHRHRRATSEKKFETSATSFAGSVTSASTGSQAPELEPAPSPRAAAVSQSAHNGVTAERRTRARHSRHPPAQESENKVIGRSNGTPPSRPAPTRGESTQISGVKHITDMN